MPNHSYIFVPTREMWPASSVNSLLPRCRAEEERHPEPGREREAETLKPSDWLDQHRPVEQMTWAPGEPLTVERQADRRGRLVRAPRHHDVQPVPPARRAARQLSQRRPLGRAGAADLSRRRRPHHHVLRAPHPAPRDQDQSRDAARRRPGIGKDTILEPLKLGVGPWNFKEVSPQDIMSNYNDYMRCVVLRISEAHDLGDINRYAFHDHMKTILAAPPDVIRVNGKYIPQHYVLNVAGVIYTTNNRFDGIYLPPNDRRTYVAWSEIRRRTSSDGFWTDFWAWYKAGGLEDVGRVPDGIRPLEVRSKGTAEEDRGVLADRGSRRSPGKRCLGLAPSAVASASRRQIAGWSTRRAVLHMARLRPTRC